MIQCQDKKLIIQTEVRSFFTQKVWDSQSNDGPLMSAFRIKRNRSLGTQGIEGYDFGQESDVR